MYLELKHYMKFLLIERGEYSKARSRINRLRDLDPEGSTYRRLRAQLAAKQGDQALVLKPRA